MANNGELHFEKLGGILPCVVQDAKTDKVLMLGFMNKEALAKTRAENRVTFFSRSKQRLWTKGETSGHYLEVVDIVADCDSDTLLIRVNPHGATCHTGSGTCFNEDNAARGVEFLEQIIISRKQKPVAGSYTNGLLDAGINRVAQKVGEEAVELVIAAKDDKRDEFLGEAADLMYHYLVLLAAKGACLQDVVTVLRARHKST